MATNNKPCDFGFQFPARAERVDYDELSPEEKEALMLPSRPSARAIFRFPIIVDRTISISVKDKYRWESLKGISFAIKIYSGSPEHEIRFSSGLFPRKDHKEVKLDFSLEFDKFLKASMATIIAKQIPGKYWGVHAQRTDTEAQWVLMKRWIDQNDLNRFEVVCSIHQDEINATALCGICAFRANSENVLTEKAFVSLR